MSNVLTDPKLIGLENDGSARVVTLHTTSTSVQRQTELKLRNRKPLGTEGSYRNVTILQFRPKVASKRSALRELRIDCIDVSPVPFNIEI